MPFQFINNRTQSIAVKGLLVTASACLILQFSHLLSLGITLPFTMPWAVVWLIGYSADKKDRK